MPGASGITAALLLQQRGPFDGSTIALLQRNNFYAPLLDKTLSLRPRSLNWLGSLNQEFYAVVARAGAPVKSWEDLLTTKPILGATSFGNENRTFAALMNDFMGTKFEIVTGYAGNSEIDIALERGEVQSRMQTVNSLTAGPEAEALVAGRIRLIAQIGMSNAPQFPDLKNMMDLAVNDEARAVASFLLAPLAAGRPFAAPPGVPADRVAALRVAFDAAAADPEFLAEMKKRNSSIEAITGAEVQTIVEGLWKAPDPVLAKVRTLLDPPK